MTKKYTDIDMQIPLHSNKLDSLDKQSIDFEQRLRSLEKYQERQIGFFAANKLWITIFVVMLLNAAITVAIKVYVRQDAPQQTTAPKLSSQTI